MKGVLLCAGFATRLYPLTAAQPKPLLRIAGEPILNYSVKQLESIPSLNETVLVSNGKFYDTFLKWRDDLDSSLKINVLNDGCMDNDHRLGAVRDLSLALESVGCGEDVLVVAGDNLFDSEFKPFISFAQAKKPAVSVGVYNVKARELAQKYGLVETDSSGKITAFFEKPKNPPTTLASTGVYFFPKETLVFIERYLETNKNPDAPGYYLSWLFEKIDLFAYTFGGVWFDIGDMTSYQKADQYFRTNAR